MTMLVLLMLIFFMGIFLPITRLHWLAWIIYTLSPMSSIIRGFKDYLLVGQNAYALVWFALTLIRLL